MGFICCNELFGLATVAAVDIFCPDVAEAAQTGGQLGSVGVSSPLCSPCHIWGISLLCQGWKIKKGTAGSERGRGRAPIPSHSTSVGSGDGAGSQGAIIHPQGIGDGCPHLPAGLGHGA